MSIIKSNTLTSKPIKVRRPKRPIGPKEFINTGVSPPVISKEKENITPTNLTGFSPQNIPAKSQKLSWYQRAAYRCTCYPHEIASVHFHFKNPYLGFPYELIVYCTFSTKMRQICL
jgi:hypothetical protein